jgi:hypothetical protein
MYKHIPALIPVFWIAVVVGVFSGLKLVFSKEKIVASPPPKQQKARDV